jgi:hypothetical protein
MHQSDSAARVTGNGGHYLQYEFDKSTVSSFDYDKHARSLS